VLRGILILGSFAEFAMDPVGFSNTGAPVSYYHGDIDIDIEANSNDSHWQYGLPAYDTNGVVYSSFESNYITQYSALRRGFEHEPSPTSSDVSSCSQAPSSKTSYDDYIADPVCAPVPTHRLKSNLGLELGFFLRCKFGLLS
jgi:hypothetical protein